MYFNNCIWSYFYLHSWDAIQLYHLPPQLPSAVPSLFLFICLFIYRERGREGKNELEKHRCERNISWLLLTWAVTWDWTGNPGVCPDQESNWGPYALQVHTQATELHWSGQSFSFIAELYFIVWMFQSWFICSHCKIFGLFPVLGDYE